ncbi:DMT family transporter [Rhizobacter sp. Root404]|uniref:DMT family transporter n=1 Tax=Rhizobacter sp. Root404 TaxID=1736528 RepID=UPI0009E894CB|nr:DMT family transporter [Rhizobacter sp. Root404]
MTAPPLQSPDADSIASNRWDRLIGVLCGLVVILLFSGFTLVSRLGFSTSLRVVDLAALRFTIGGLIMLPVLIHYGLTGVRWRDALALAVTGGFGFALCAYTGFALAPASHGAVLLHGTLPLFTFALAWFLPAAQPTRRRVFGLATIFLGIVAMAWDSLGSSTPRQLLGDISLLLASISWSAYGLLARRRGLAPGHSASIVAVFSMCGFLPIYALLPDKALFNATWHELAVQGVFQGVLVGALSVFVYSRAVASLGAVETSLFTAAVPCVTATAALLLLGESPSTLAWIGVSVVTLGMTISLRPSRSISEGVACRDGPEDFFSMYDSFDRYASYRGDDYQLLNPRGPRRVRIGGPGDDPYLLIASIDRG